jgi:hypothetical protein
MDEAMTIRQIAASRCKELPLYSLYGVTLASDFPFANRLSQGFGISNVTFSMVESSPAVGWEKTAPVFAHPILIDSGASLLYVYRQQDYHVLRFTEVADFYLWPERIVCHLLDPAYEYKVEIDLLGFVFSLWLELQGTPALHASAAVVGDRAVVFLATNSGGKSSLAASLMQAGCPLLTDDILPVERHGGVFKGRPGYPQMRMWPEQAQHFLGYYEELDIVHPAYSKRCVPVGADGFGTFCDASQPLACFYLPERRDPVEWGTGIEFTQISGVEGLMSLLGQSFIPNTVEALGLRANRLGLLAQMVSQVPVRRVVYPDGFDYLPSVRQAIIDDLANLSLG